MAKPLRFSFGETDVLLKYCHGVLSPSPFSKLLARTLSEYVPTIITSVNTALDVGSGSGIQAILLAKLGLKSVYAVDIDPRSVSATEFNALLNGVSEWVPSSEVVYAHFGDMFQPLSEMKFDLIVSNPPSLPMSEDTPRFASGGSYPQEFLDNLIMRSAHALNTNGRLLMTLSSLAGLRRTGDLLQKAGFNHRILRRKQERFRDFYYPHISYYRRSQLEGVAGFKELPNGELAETIYVIEAILAERATTQSLVIEKAYPAHMV